MPRKPRSSNIPPAFEKSEAGDFHIVTYDLSGVEEDEQLDRIVEIMREQPASRAKRPGFFRLVYLDRLDRITYRSIGPVEETLDQSAEYFYDYGYEKFELRMAEYGELVSLQVLTVADMRLPKWRRRWAD